MILDRTAAYVLAAAFIFQTLLPSPAAKPHRWRSIDVQVGKLRFQATDEAGSIRFELAPEHRACASDTGRPRLQSWQEQPKKLRVCVNDSSCMTAWLDRTTHRWLLSSNKI